MTPSSLRRVLLRILIGTLSLVALVLIAALVTGDLDETDAKVIGTSLLFAAASTLSASGVAVRARDEGWAWPLGTTAIATSLAAFGLVTVGIWLDPQEEGFWRLTGCVGIVALETAHASFVLAGRRPRDTGAVRVITHVAVATAAIGGAGAVLGVTGVIDEPGDGAVELFGVILVVQLLCTVLPGLLRRLAGAPRERPLLAPADPVERLVAEVAAATARIEHLAPDPRVRAECERLRRAAAGLG
jgi:hypothetical protein